MGYEALSKILAKIRVGVKFYTRKMQFTELPPREAFFSRLSDEECSVVWKTAFRDNRNNKWSPISTDVRNLGRSRGILHVCTGKARVFQAKV